MEGRQGEGKGGEWSDEELHWDAAEEGEGREEREHASGADLSGLGSAKPVVSSGVAGGRRGEEGAHAESISSFASMRGGGGIQQREALSAEASRWLEQESLSIENEGGGRGRGRD